MSEGTHSYYDWQVSTLMLAYDVAEPLPRTDEKRLAEREQKVQEELRDMVHKVLPKQYLDNPQSDFPPQVVSLLTRATLARAHAIVNSSSTGAD